MVILPLVLVYVIAGQSKLRALIGTIALQCIRTVEAISADKSVSNCNSGLLKTLMIFNLVIVVSLLLRKIKKSILFQGQPYSNLVKIKFILANTKSYISLNLNQLTGNVHLFKLIGNILPS